MGIAALLAAASLAATPVSYVQAHQESEGGFSEARGTSSPQLTAWAALGLRASGRETGRALEYLQAHEDEVGAPTAIALVAAAEAALGADSGRLLERLPNRPRAVNEAIWTLIALRQARRQAPKSLVNYVLRSQAPRGGFAWARGIPPDSNDTAFAIQALRAAGVRGRPVSRALAFLRTFERQDGGFELTRGRGSDAQSTAVAIQAFVSAGATPPGRAFRYLAGLRQPDGSFRYSRRYAATPVWVTSQVLPALARKAFPLPS
jgi:prenyltransferase beta subunit